MKNDFKKNLVVIVSISLLIKMLGLLYRFVLARILNIDGMTLFSLLSPIMSLALCLSNLSIPVVVNQKVSENSTNDTYSNRSLMLSAFRITLISSSIISIILLVFGTYITKNIYKNELLYIPLITTIPLIYLSNFSGVFKGYLDAHRYFKISAKSNLYEQIFKIISSTLLVLILGKKGLIPAVIGAVIGMVFSEVVSFLYLLIKVKKITNFKYIKKTENTHKEILNQATPLTINHLIFSFVSFLEPILFTFSTNIIGYTNNEAQRFFALVTSYAFPLLTMAFFASHSISKAIFPYISSNKTNTKENNFLIKKSLLFSLAIGIINFNVTFFYPELLLKILYNNTESYKIVRILSPFYLFYYFSPVLVTALQALGHEKKLLINNVISHIIELILIIILCQIKSIGLYGICYSIGICFIVGQFLHYLTLRKKIHFRIDFNTIMNLFIFIAFNMFLNFFLIDKLLPIINIILINSLSLLIIMFYYKKSLIDGGNK